MRLKLLGILTAPAARAPLAAGDTFGYATVVPRLGWRQGGRHVSGLAR